MKKHMQADNPVRLALHLLTRDFSGAAGLRDSVSGVVLRFCSNAARIIAIIRVTAAGWKKKLANGLE